MLCAWYLNIKYDKTYSHSANTSFIHEKCSLSLVSSSTSKTKHIHIIFKPAPPLNLYNVIEDLAFYSGLVTRSQLFFSFNYIMWVLEILSLMFSLICIFSFDFYTISGPNYLSFIISILPYTSYSQVCRPRKSESSSGYIVSCKTEKSTYLYSIVTGCHS